MHNVYCTGCIKVLVTNDIEEQVPVKEHSQSQYSDTRHWHAPLFCDIYPKTGVRKPLHHKTHALTSNKINMINSLQHRNHQCRLKIEYWVDLGHRKTSATWTFGVNINKKSMRALKEQHGIGVSFLTISKPWDVCAQYRSTQKNHLTTANTTPSMTLKLVYMDLIEPFKPKAISGYQHVAKCTDVFAKGKYTTRGTYLTSKSEAITSLCSFVQNMATPNKLRVSRLKCDKGEE